MTKNNWESNRLVAIEVLAVLIGTIGIGCQSFATTNFSQPTPEKNSLTLNTPNGDILVNQSENIAAIKSSSQEVPGNIVNSTKESELGDLQESMSYPQARQILIQQGWQPNLQGEPPNLRDSVVGRLFDLGYQEVKDCSGTGEGLCLFEFINEKEELLSVVTVPTDNTERLVRNWWIDKWNGPVLPFVGTRYFNFLGGTGTGHTITIEENGTMTVEINGTIESSVLYQGEFSNPIFLDNGLGLLLSSGQIYQLSADGKISEGCKREGTICEADLYDPEFRP